MKYFMTVILQKKSNTIIILILLLPFCSIAQQGECNRETFYKFQQKGVPKNICIPNGLVISYIYSMYEKIDFNLDGLNDCVFLVSKRHKNIGDTTILYFYKQNPDTTYSFFGKYNNVYPQYFDPNIEGPDLADPKLHNLFWNCYQIPDPIMGIEFNQDTIVITTYVERHRGWSQGYEYIFKFSKNDWKLVGEELWDTNNTKKLEIQDSILLKEFSYCRKEY